MAEFEWILLAFRKHNFGNYREGRHVGRPGRGRGQGIRSRTPAWRPLVGNLRGLLPAWGMSGESLIFFLPTESCSELPPVENSIFVAEESEGQIQGIYVCIKGYHLVGKKTFFCNASLEWNAPVPTCQCKFELSVSSYSFPSHSMLSHPTSRRPCSNFIRQKFSISRNSFLKHSRVECLLWEATWSALAQYWCN